MEHNPYLQLLCQNKKGSMNREKWIFSLKKEVCLTKWDFRDHTFKRIEMESWMRMSSGAKIPTKTGSQIYPSVSMCYSSRKDSRWWATAVESVCFTRLAHFPQCLYFWLAEQLLPKISSCQLLCVTGNLKHGWIHDKDSTRVTKATHLSDKKKGKSDSQNTKPLSAQEQNQHRHCQCHSGHMCHGQDGEEAKCSQGDLQAQKPKLSHSGQD